MKLWPERVLGGSSPVHAIFRHSMTVCSAAQRRGRAGGDRGDEGQRVARRQRRQRLVAPGWIQRRLPRITHRLARPIVAHDEREGAVKLDDVLVIRGE